MQLSQKLNFVVVFYYRYSLVQQIGNSAGKIVKMRLQIVLNLPTEVQLDAYNNLSITSDFMGRASVVLFVYTLTMALVKSNVSYHIAHK